MNSSHLHRFSEKSSHSLDFRGSTDYSTSYQINPKGNRQNMLNQIVNKQVTTVRDNVHVLLVDEGFDPGVAWEAVAELDFEDALV